MAELKQKSANIVRAGSSDELAQISVDTFLSAADKSITQTGIFRVAVSGGHTPQKCFELLSNADYPNWNKVELFWVDERYVPPEDEHSNYLLAAKTFLQKVGIPQENIHRIPTESTDVAQAASLYEQIIRNAFKLQPGQLPKFDLMLLGMGNDGHIGSLFPNTYSLFETEHLVSVVYVMDDKLNRITLTHPVMQAAKHLMVLISGPEKAKIVREVFEDEPDEIKYPVHTLWPILDKVTWLMDNDAARLLK